MKPHIDQTTFGSITIEGAVFSHDAMIRYNGQVKKRKKKWPITKKSEPACYRQQERWEHPQRLHQREEKHEA